MFIIFGTQKKIKKLGYVAEFCNLCRAIKPFKISKVGMEDHIFFIPLGMKNVIDHEAVCTVCQTKRDVDVMTYKSIEKASGIELEVLISKTFPGIREFHANRLQLERKLAIGTLTPEERETFILEVFHIFNTRAEENFHAAFQARGHGAWIFGITLVAAFAALLMISGSAELSPEQRENFLSSLGILFLFGIVTSVILMILQPGRTFRNAIVPALAVAFKPLNPSREELAICLEKMNHSGYIIGKKTKLVRLWNSILQPSRSYNAFQQL
jgi:hypothetical protein